jgi:hypothetical protein
MVSKTRRLLSHPSGSTIHSGPKSLRGHGSARSVGYNREVELIFADDSGKESPTSRYIIEAAVCFNESKLQPLEAHIKALKLRYAIPDVHELHWSTRKYQRRIGGQRITDRELTIEEHDQLRRDFLAFLGTAEARLIIAAVERGGARETAPLIAECLEFIAERSQMYLQDLWHRDRSTVLGLLIADDPGSSDERREITRRLQRLHRGGTVFISSFDNLVMNSLLYPSHLVPGIQLADFVAGAFNRFLNRGEEVWWTPLEPHVRRRLGTTTVILGYGLKIWPQVRPLRIGSVTIN